MSKYIKKRFWHIDALRGFAILMMVLYHIIFDLHHFFGFSHLQYNQGFWLYQGRITAILFFITTSLASVILWHKNNQTIPWKKNIQRCLTLVSLGMVITFFSYWYNPNLTIWFGTLHFLGVSIFLTTFFIPHKKLSVFTGIISLIIGIYFLDIRSITYSLLPLGIRPENFMSLDYYPLFPWIAAPFFGITIGHYLYPYLQTTPPQKNSFRLLSFLGRHSLVLYFVHQPVICGVLWVMRDA